MAGSSLSATLPWSCLVVLLSLISITTQAFDGFDLGRWNYKQFDLGTKQNPVDTLSPYHLRVSFPTTCSTQCGEFRTGGMPIVLFVTGFAGQLDAYKYDVIVSGIVKHGIIVVAVDQEFGFSLTLDYTKLGLNLQKVIGFIRNTGTNGLLAAMQSRGFVNEIYQNGAKLFMMGHSSGAHVVLQNMKDNAVSSEACADAGAVIMLSPMDGQDPLGFGGGFVVDEGKPLPFSVPGLIVAGSLDGQSSTITVGVACTPDDRGNKHFYNAWQGAINYIQATGMGTLDVLDEAATTNYDPFCAASNDTQVNERRNYRTMVRGAIVSFIEGVILNDQNYIDKLSNSRDLDFPAAVEQKGVGRAFTCSYIKQEQGIAFELQTGLILFGFLFAFTFITGLYCFFRKMDDDTLHRYHPAEGLGYEEPASFKTKLEPQYGVSGSVQNEYLKPQTSFNLGGSSNSRVPSVNV
jgi:hypothetical protein